MTGTQSPLEDTDVGRLRACPNLSSPARQPGRRYTYAADPLPNNPRFVMQAVAEVVSGQATLASCARRYPVSDKTIRKGVRNYISGEVVQLGRRGSPPGRRHSARPVSLPTSMYM